MIDYSDKELQHAAERLQHNADFRLLAEALQDEYKSTAFATAPDDASTRENCYQRHALLEELKLVMVELNRMKRESEKYGRT